MGIIQVPGRLSGRTYNIEIEGDAPTAAEQARIRAGVEERESRFVQRYEATMGKPLAEPDDGTAVGRGFERGKAGAKSVLGTTVETIGQQVGLPSIAEYGRGMEEAAAQRQFELSMLQPAPTTRQDVAAAEGFFPTIGAGLSYAGELAGEQIPQLGVGLAGGAAGAVAGGLAAGPAGALTGFGVGSGLVEAPMLFGANVQRQEEEVAAGRKDAVDLTDALGATVGQSALTAVTNAIAGAGVFLRPGAKLFTRVGSGAAVGGTTEGLNEIGQQMLERQQAGLPVDSEDAIQEYIDAGVAGGVLGFGAGGIGGIAGPRVAEAGPGEPPPPAQGEAPPEAPQGGAPTVSEEEVTERTVDARGIYDERLAVALDSGASEPEAEQLAARAALNYISELPEPVQAQLGAFKSTMEARATASVSGVMPPDLPDSAYASEFGAATQQELFAEPTPAPEPTVDLPGLESEADAFERAAAQYAPTRTAAPMVKAPEPKPEQVLTDDLVTQLGVGSAKSASLRKLVGKPVQDAKVIKALDSWAQNPKAEPEQKALAASLITGQPVQGDLLAEPKVSEAPEAEAPKAEAPKAGIRANKYAVSTEDAGDFSARVVRAPDGSAAIITDGSTSNYAPEFAANKTDTELLAYELEPVGFKQASLEAAPVQEALDVTQTAETQPEEVGAGVPSGGPSVEGRGQPAGDAQPAEEPTALGGIGLGGNMSVPVGTDTAAGAEQSALTEEEQLNLFGALPTTQAPRVPVRSVEQIMRDAEPSAEQQLALDFTPPYNAGTGAARQYIPGTITRVNRALQPTGETRLEESDIYAPPAAPAMKPDAMVEVDKLLANRYQTTTTLGVKRGAKLLNEVGIKQGVRDPLSVKDKQAVLTLLFSRAEALSPQAAAAKLYFSKVLRPIDAILMVVDDLTAPYGKYRAEPGTDAAYKDFFAGTGRTAARQALDFIRARMSPAVQAEVDFRIALSEQQNKNQETWLADSDRVELAREARKQAKAARAEAAKESGYISEAMSTDPLAAMDRELHYSVKMALDGGNLRLALRALSATTNNADLAALAARFADFAGTTRVKVLYPGDPADNIGDNRGIYWAAPSGSNPEQTNIIYLNGQTGMDAHVLMHEMAHAVTVDLSFTQPNHPVIKQLESLLKSLRAQVSPPNLRGEYPAEFYGLTSLREFMAEAYGRVAMGANDNGLRDLMKRTEFTDYTSARVELPLTNWERFKEIIGNFLRGLIGRPSKPYPRRTKTQTTKTTETGLDRFHRLVDGLLSEAPSVLPDSVFQKAVSEPMVARTVLNNAIQSAPAWDKAGRDKLADQMKASTPMPVRRALLGLLHLDWFNDLAGKYFPQIAQLKTLDDLRRGEIVAMEERAKAVMEDMLAYANKQPEMYSKLMSIMGRATLEEVDPTQPLSTYIMDKDKTRVWHELNNALSNSDSTGEMRNLFKTVRNMFAQFREDIKAVLSERVKEMTDDKATQNQLIARLMQKLDEEKAIDPYFTLMRKGDFWLTYTADDTTAPAVVDPNTGVSRKPPTQFVQAFNTVWERDQFRRKLEATTGADGQPVARDFEELPRPTGYNPDRPVPTEFAQGAINIIGSLVSGSTDPDSKIRAEAAIAAVQDMFVRFTPEHSIMQSFNKRKGTRGFMGDITPLGVVDRPTDMVQALAEKTSSLAYQLANIKYGAKIQALKNTSRTTLDNLKRSQDLTAGEKQAVIAYHDEFMDRATFAQSPRVSGTAQVARGVTFGMTLGFSVAAALNNLMQIPMIGTTELGGRYGLGASIRELGSAGRLLMNAGKTKRVRSFGPDGMVLRDSSSVDDFGSVANYFEVNDKGEYVLRSDKPIPKALRNKLANLDVLVEALSANGMLTNSMAQEMLDADAGFLQRINQWSGSLMHQAERFNRQTMAVAAYNLELGKITGPVSREAKIAAAKKAIEITERVNGSIGASTAPRYAQGAIGSVVFMFKRFGLHMARYIIGTANQALRGASKEDRAVARYQIIGMLGTTALFAGVQGLPFFGELMTVFNLLFTDDEEEPAEVVIEKFLQEPFYHGALNYLTGAEIASRISMSGLIFRENKIEKDQSALYDLFEMLGGPAVGVFMNTERGIELLSQGELYRGVEAMMPSVIKSGMKATRFAADGATTLRGDEVIPVSNLDIALQMIGYTPGAYAREQERVSGAKKIDEAVRSKKRQLLRKYNLAFREGDFAEVREVLKEMREFSRTYPEDAISGETLTRSQRSFQQRSQEMIGGVSFSPTGRGRAEQYISEYDEDTSLWGG
jgi:hypothetical protein